MQGFYLLLPCLLTLGIAFAHPRVGGVLVWHVLVTPPAVLLPYVGTAAL
jgi:hypothetical protein